MSEPSLFYLSTNFGYITEVSMLKFLGPNNIMMVLYQSKVN